MPQVSAKAARLRSTTRIGQDRIRPTDVTERNGRDIYGCASDRCAEPAIETSPVPLCPRHLRQVYEYAQGLIGERLIPVVDELVAEYQQQQDQQTG